MPTTRPYRRTSLLLKGHTPGILTLEQQSALSYALQGTHFPQGAALLLFFRGQPPIRTTAMRGSLPTRSIDDLQGAALCSAERIHAQAQAAGFDVSAACRQYWDAQPEEASPDTTAEAGSISPHTVPSEGQPVAQEATEVGIRAPSSAAPSQGTAKTGIHTVPMQGETAVQRETPTASPCTASAAPLPDPFGGYIKNAVWKRISYPYFANGSHYLSGEILCEGRTAVRLLAIPGEYAVSPPAWLAGFDCFWQSPHSCQGYWLFACDSATGQPVSIRSLCAYPAPGGSPPAASVPPGKHNSSAASAPPPVPR